MPLTVFQTAIARLLAKNRTLDSYLAGAAALHIAPNSRRYSNDLDYFNDSEERVATAFADDRRLLSEAGYRLDVVMQQPGYIRAIAGLGNEATKIEWAHDSAWRFLPPVPHELTGYQLHPVDLAVNKLLALVGREEPRDYLDVHDIIKRILPLGALCWAAAGKDPGFTPTALLEMLRRRGKYRPEDFARLHLVDPVDVVELKQSWLAALANAEAFIATRPPEELGCLYYEMESGRFVEPQPGAKVVPHYGRPGGIMPRLLAD